MFVHRKSDQAHLGPGPGRIEIGDGHQVVHQVSTIIAGIGVQEYLSVEGMAGIRHGTGRAPQDVDEFATRRQDLERQRNGVPAWPDEAGIPSALRVDEISGQVENDDCVLPNGYSEAGIEFQRGERFRLLSN